MKVLFPEPDAPITATKSPLWIWRVTPRRARTSTSPTLYVRSRERTSTTGLEGATGTSLRLLRRAGGVAGVGRAAAGDDHLIAFREIAAHLGALSVGEAERHVDRLRLAVDELVDHRGLRIARLPRAGCGP